MSIEKSFPLVRMETFSDAVIAIVITIMALEIKIPEIHFPAEHGAFWFMLPLVPKLVTYLLGFFLVGIGSMQHMRALRLVAKLNTSLIWANLFYLFSISLVPSTTAFLGDHPSLPQAVSLWAFTTSLTLTAGHIFYAVSHRETPPEKSAHRRNACSWILIFPSIFLAFYSVYGAWVLMSLGFGLQLLPKEAVNAIFDPEHFRRPSDKSGANP